VVVEPSKVNLADLLARRTLERQPTMAGAQGGEERRVIEQLAASVPDLDDPLSARTHHRVNRARARLFAAFCDPKFVGSLTDGVAWSCLQA
jgi:hypothetical protein